MERDGVATKVGNKYVGEVSHFTWWNFDLNNTSTVLLTFNFVDGNGNPLSNIYLDISSQLSSGHANGITDNNGQISGLLPANETLIINVPIVLCSATGTPFSITVGPFTTDTVVPIVLISQEIATTEISGTLVKCDNTEYVTNGYVLLNRDGNYTISQVTNGAFSFHNVYCQNGENSQFTLKGVDYDNFQTTGVINYTYTSPITTIGNITACNAITEFISYEFDNQKTIITDNLFVFIDGFGSNTFELGGSLNPSFSLIMNINTPGIYPMDNFQIDGNFPIINFNTTTNSTVMIHLNKFGDVGDYIDLTFEGSYNTNSDGSFHTISGTVHVFRYN